MEKQIINKTQLRGKSVSEILKGMQVNETVVIPNEKYSAMMQAKTRISIECGMAFKTKFDRNSKILSISRIE